MVASWAVFRVSGVDFSGFQERVFDACQGFYAVAGYVELVRVDRVSPLLRTMVRSRHRTIVVFVDGADSGAVQWSRYYGHVFDDCCAHVNLRVDVVIRVIFQEGRDSRYCWVFLSGELNVLCAGVRFVVAG